MKCIPYVLTGAAALLLSLGAVAQEMPAFAFRMVFTHPATDSAYASEHPAHHTFEERAAEP